MIIDPQRDIDRIEAVLAHRGVQLAAVAETHAHNDYVSGGLELARIGIDRPAVRATAPVEQLVGEHGLANFPTATFADLAAIRERDAGAVILDVRTRRVGGRSCRRRGSRTAARAAQPD